MIARLGEDERVPPEAGRQSRISAPGSTSASDAAPFASARVRSSFTNGTYVQR